MRDASRHDGPAAHEPRKILLQERFAVGRFHQIAHHATIDVVADRECRRNLRDLFGHHAYRSKPEPHAADLFGYDQTQKAQLAGLQIEIAGEFVGFFHLCHAGRDIFFGELLSALLEQFEIVVEKE